LKKASAITNEGYILITQKQQIPMDTSFVTYKCNHKPGPLLIGASLSEPHTSNRFCTVNHSQSKMENYENSKYHSYGEPYHGVCAHKYHAISKYRKENHATFRLQIGKEETVRWKEKKD